MSNHFFLFCVLTLTLLSSSAVEVPSSARSRTVVARVEPRLKEEVRKLGLTLGAPVYIRIFKEPAKLEVWMLKDSKYRLFRAYDICKVSGKLGPKLKEGDRQAPEGCYNVTPKQMNPNSSYHLSFNLGFPNDFDRHHRRTGNALMVHGSCVSIGCYAMEDEAIEEIWTLCVRAFENGQASLQVHCFPFPLNHANLNRHKDSQWIEFWKDLEPIYNSFEKTRIPPSVSLVEGKYKLGEKPD
jgi:murein L,D-transpeptidase YafK